MSNFPTVPTLVGRNGIGRLMMAPPIVSLVLSFSIGVPVSRAYAGELPLLWYDFNDALVPTQNRGSLGSGYDGDLEGDAHFVPFASAFAVAFDGDSDWVIPIGSESAFDIGDGDFSLFARVVTTHVDATCGDAERGLIWKERTGGSNPLPGYTLGVIKASGLPRLVLHAPTPVVWVIGTMRVNDGQTHDILAVREADTLLLYVDGVLDASAAVPPGIGSTNNDQLLVIGGRTLPGVGCTFTDDFDGIIDEIRIYDEAVTPGDIVSAVDGDPLPEYRIEQNCPNPFYETTTIRMNTVGSSADPRTIVIFDVRGQAVRHLQFGEASDAEADVTWDSRDDHGVELPSGTYFYRLVGAADARKTILLR